MINFFYGAGLLVAITNFVILINFKEIFALTEWFYKFKKVAGRNPLESDFRNQGDKEVILMWSNIVIFTLLWMIFGLLTSDWIIFIAIFITNIFFNFLKRKLDNLDKIKYFLSFLKTFIGTATVSFLVINHFHLHIDLTRYLISLFQ
jgi:hypothetical protein